MGTKNETSTATVTDSAKDIELVLVEQEDQEVVDGKSENPQRLMMRRLRDAARVIPGWTAGGLAKSYFTDTYSFEMKGRTSRIYFITNEVEFGAAIVNEDHIIEVEKDRSIIGVMTARSNFYASNGRYPDEKELEEQLAYDNTED